ncbi:M48 family metallopeptidase [Chitinimonas lacunae]|uniref:M48 family metalloprotease n=1 Tax=Chitinimonas lacunae TaxID=1963018 RepID=A0ABV8MVC7_9NEIS
MNKESYEALVAQLVREADDHPELFRRKTALLVLLGLGYLGLLLTLALVMMTLAPWWLTQQGLGVVGIGTVLAGLMLGASTLITLYLPFSLPEGELVDEHNAPELMRAIDKVRRAVNGPRLDAVWLTTEFGVSLIQHNRFGWFGQRRRHLTIGLPLLHCLSGGQFAAVLAHEYSHLPRGGGHPGAWIYHQRQLWRQLAERLGEVGWLGWTLRPFLFHYWPHFDAYTFVFCRNEEFQADRLAAEVAGPRHTADALLAMHLRADFLEKDFWPRQLAVAEREPAPVGRPFATLPLALRASFDEAIDRDRLRALLAVKRSRHDTHPTLTERLVALQMGARVVPPPEHSAAERVLGHRAVDWARLLDERWREEIHGWWRDEFRAAERAQERLRQWDEVSPGPAGARFEYAVLTERYRPDSDPVPLYQNVLQQDPHHMGAHYAIGRLLVAKGHIDGLHHLDYAAHGDNLELSWAACQHAARFLESRGQEVAARRYQERAEALLA